MKFETTEIKCMDCGKKFLGPALGGHSYGSFIFSGEKGNVFGYFQACENPAWNFMETVIKQKGVGYKAKCNHGERLQAACAYFADAINGQRLKNNHACPCCFSTNTHSTSHERVGVVEVSNVSHLEFMSWPESIRRAKVLEFDLRRI